MSESNSPQPSSSASTPKPRVFKPRANIARKTKAEREAHAKQEAEKAAARAATAVQTAGKPQSAKTNPSKKREQTRDHRETGQGALRSVFGAGSGSRPAWNKKLVDEGFSEVLEGQEGVKPSDGPVLLGGGGDDTVQRGHGSGAGKSVRKAEDGTLIESDNELGDPRRRDIETITIVDDGDQDDDEQEENDPIGHGKGKARSVSEGRKIKQSLALRPVRAPKVSLEDQDAAVKKREDKKAVKSSRTVVEDVDDDDEMTLDDPVTTDQARVKRDAPSSPELPKRARLDKRLGSRVKDARLATETFEERAERIRLYEDIEKLKHEFVVSPKLKSDDDGKIEEEERRHEGKLFLFQFPPLVPYLVDQESLLREAQEKRDTTALRTMTKSDPDGPAESQISEETDPAASQTALPKTEMEGMLTATEPLRLPSGSVGKLKIHKSGKVSLDWGGTDMEVRYGTEVDFLQDVVLVESPGVPPAPSEDDSNVASSHSGTAYALGQVEKKMIVIPDWQKLYD